MMGDDELANIVNSFTNNLSKPAPADRELHDEDPLVDALLDAESYRLLAQQAIHALHDYTQQLRQLREQQQRLLDQYRHLRAQTVRSEAA